MLYWKLPRRSGPQGSLASGVAPGDLSLRCLVIRMGNPLADTERRTRGLKVEAGKIYNFEITYLRKLTRIKL